jgi:hypothetical protein
MQMRETMTVPQVGNEATRISREIMRQRRYSETMEELSLLH